jgi:hypothetical protein
LYVPNLATVVNESAGHITTLQGTVDDILKKYVTKDDLGGDGNFNFVK